MSELLDWRSAPTQEAIGQFAERIRGGDIVILPTDTTYVAVAAATSVSAVDRLREYLRYGPDRPIQFAVANTNNWLVQLPDLPVALQRVVRRAWPGPVSVLLPPSQGSRVLPTVAAEIQNQLSWHDSLAFRIPAHQILWNLAQTDPTPFMLVDLYNPEGKAIVAADEISALPESLAELAVTDGPTYFSEMATIIRNSNGQIELVHSGVINAEDVAQLSACQILFVCTGNTCRSPMAEALCKKLLSDRLGCTMDELPSRGIIVRSAGIAAMNGSPASPEAVELMQSYGANLAGHSSQSLTLQILEQADHIFTMTQRHLATLQSVSQNLSGQPQLLSPTGEDITDPIGASADVYRVCAEQLWLHLQHRVKEMEID